MKNKNKKVLATKDSYVTGGQVNQIAQTAAPLLNIAGTAMGVPMLGSLISAGTGLWAGAEQQKLQGQQQQQDAYSAMLNSNQKTFEDGGMVPLNSNAMHVTGAPNETDGNAINYKGKDIRLDYNETLDTKNDRVISDKYFNPLTGKKISDEDRSIKKSIGKLERKNDPISKETIKELNKREDALFRMQEVIAMASGDRPQQGMQQYANGGPIVGIQNSKVKFDSDKARQVYVKGTQMPTGVLEVQGDDGKIYKVKRLDNDQYRFAHSSDETNSSNPLVAAADWYDSFGDGMSKKVFGAVTGVGGYRDLSQSYSSDKSALANAGNMLISEFDSLPILPSKLASSTLKSAAKYGISNIDKAQVVYDLTEDNYADGGPIKGGQRNFSYAPEDYYMYGDRAPAYSVFRDKEPFMPTSPEYGIRKPMFMPDPLKPMDLFRDAGRPDSISPQNDYNLSSDRMASMAPPRNGNLLNNPIYTKNKQGIEFKKTADANFRTQFENKYKNGIPSNNSVTPKGNDFNSKFTTGDYLTMASGVLGNLPLAIAAMKKPEKEPYRLVNSPLTYNPLDPSQSLRKNSENYNAMMFDAANRSSNGAMLNALGQNAFANKMRTDNDVLANFANSNQGLYTQYQDRLANRQAVNNNSMLNTDQVNAQNRANRYQAQQALGHSIGNIGSTIGAGMNQRKQEEIFLNAQKTMNGDVFNRLFELYPELRK